MHRRHWLKLAMAQAAGLAPGAGASTPRLEGDPFTLGVASGHPQPTSVVLWTRLMAPNPLRNAWADQEMVVSWELSDDPGFARIVGSGSTAALPALAHSVHAEVQGLAPGRVYFYRFRCQDATSPVGRTRTAPEPQAELPRLRLGVASCQRYHSGTFDAYDALRADDPDLVVFLGDYIYESGANPGEPRGDWAYPAQTLDQYRGLYELAHKDAALQALHALCPWMVIWDDHEVQNDYAGGEVRSGARKGRLATRMADAYQAWYEHVPVSPRVLAAADPAQAWGREMRIYHELRWGRLARLFALDGRQYRSPPVRCGIGGLFDPADCAERLDPERTLLGSEQEAWLLKRLASAADDGAGWHLLCQPSVFSEFPIPLGGTRLNADNWGGYAASRQRIIDACVRHRTPNPVVLGGDIHQSWVAHVHKDAVVQRGEVVMPEFCFTSVTTRSIGALSARDMLTLAPHAVHADRDLRGYGRIDVTPQRMQVDLRMTGGPEHRAAGPATLASFEVKAGSAQVHRIAARS